MLIYKPPLKTVIRHLAKIVKPRNKRGVIHNSIRKLKKGNIKNPEKFSQRLRFAAIGLGK